MDKNKYKFQKLTPIKDSKLGVYTDALNYVFSEDDFKNIAITGPYSSGKSSVIETYKSYDEDKKFIHISLAHFETATNISADLNATNISTGLKKNNQNFEADIKTVEGKILNQLIHQIDSKDIPQTRFKVKRPLIKKEKYILSVASTIFIALMIFLLKRNSWVTFVDGMTTDWLKYLLILTTKDWFAIISLLLAGFFSYIGFFNILKLQHNKNFLKKLSIQGNDIEIFENDDDSFFDKHLNEVLYLFLNTKADAIIFEDMDRYNSNQIFEKLREINYLLNNSPNNASKKVFRFFYLLRDDIFTSKDRAKFFDFIIPIVPIIDGGNSFDKFIEHFKSGGIYDSFDSSFLEEISMYIDDMRLLKNIYNEYRIYHEQIQGTELDCNKLLAMILYKNLFPRDFSELQLGKGYVNRLFRNKQKFISKEILNVEKQISEIKILLQNADREYLESIDELDLIFIGGSEYIYDVNGRDVNSFKSKLDFLREMKAHPNEVYRYNNNYGRRHFDVTSIFEKMHENQNYILRKEAIENKEEVNRNILTDKLQKLNNDKEDLENATLSEIIKTSKEMALEVFASTYKDEINIDYNYNDVKGSHYFPIIKYLIRNKYIDESYSDYMSYFYEQSISKNDKIFIRSVFDVEAKSFTYNLKDPALVSSKINKRYYSEPEILNFDIFAFLLETQDSKLSIFLNQLRDKNRIDFVLEFWRTGREKLQFIRCINNAWTSMCLKILINEFISMEDKNSFLIDTFYHAERDDIIKMNIDGNIAKYISTCEDFLSVVEPNIHTIIEVFKLIGVRFKNINYSLSNKNLFNKVYSNNLYEINQSMIFTILEKVYLIDKSDDFYNKNYTLIMSKPNEALASYIEKDMYLYVKFILNICKNKFNDDEENVIKILNHKDIENKQKESYISILGTEVNNLRAINDSALWPTMLSHHCVPCSKDNILTYYFNSDNKFDSMLTDFINLLNLEEGLSYDYVMKSYSKEQSDDFYEAFITNNALSNVKYERILSTFAWVYDQFSFKNIDDDKIKILIKLKIIHMNAENLSFIRENYPNCKMNFINENIDMYSQTVISEENSNFDLSELEYLLEENKTTDKNLLKLLSLNNKPISVSGLSISHEVKKYILEYNYNEIDLESLIYEYEDEPSDIQNIILELCTDDAIEKIIEKNTTIPFELLIKLLQSSEISDKKELLISQLVNLTQQGAIECFEILEDINSLTTVFEGKNPLIEIDNLNTEILNIIEEKGWISSFAEDKDKGSYYRVRAKRNSDNKNLNY